MKIALFDKNEYDDLEAYWRFGKVSVHTRYNGAAAKGADIAFCSHSRPPDGPRLIVNMGGTDRAHLTHVKQSEILQAPDWYSHEVARWTLSRVPVDPALRVAVVGRGRVGRRVHRFLRARGYRVRIYPHSEPLLEPVHLISLHVRLTDETKGKYGTGFLIRQEGVVLLNSARRALVPDDDLRDALRKGRVCRASIDQGKDFGDPRVEVTPHVAWKGPWAARRRPLVILKILQDFADGRIGKN